MQDAQLVGSEHGAKLDDLTGSGAARDTALFVFTRVVDVDLEQEAIELYAVEHIANIGDEIGAIKALVPGILIAPSADSVPVRLAEIAHRIAARLEIEFAGSRFPWGGKQRELQLLLDGTPWPPAAADMSLGLPLGPEPPPQPHSTSLRWLIAIGLVIAAAVTYALVRLLPNR